MKAIITTIITLLSITSASGQITANIQHATNTTQDNGSISISVTGGEAPYEYSWYSLEDPLFSAGQPNIYTLSPGTYCVIVTDSYCGEITECFDVLACGNLIIPDPITEMPDCGPDALGSILFNTYKPKLGSGNHITSDNDGLSYIWSTGASTASLIDVTEGTYSITVTDNAGCTASREVVLTADDRPLITDVEVEQICGSDDEGSIDLFNMFLDSHNEHMDLVFTWSTGDDDEYVDDLDAGEYCVTVTNIDAPACTAEACWTIEPYSGVDMTIQYESTTTCSSIPSGTISVDVFDATGEVSTQLTGPGILYNGTATTFDGLAAGIYNLRVKDNCSLIHQQITINNAFDVSYTVSQTAGCELYEVVLAIDPPAVAYDILWADGTTGPTNLLPVGAHSVRISDGSGCVTNERVSIEGEGLNIFSTNHTCYGAAIGEFTVNVDNPNNLPVVLNINDIVYTTQPLSLSGLEAGDYIVSAQIGQCSYEKTVTISQEQRRSIYKGYDKNKRVCIHDIWCGNQFLYTNEEEPQPTPAHECSGSGNAIFGCKTCKACNTSRGREIVETSRGLWKSMPVGMFWLHLKSLLNDPSYDYYHVQNVLETFENETNFPNDLCFKVSYCPGSLVYDIRQEIFGYGLGVKGQSLERIEGTNCWRLRCSKWYIPNLGPSFVQCFEFDPDVYDPPEDCNYREITRLQAYYIYTSNERPEWIEGAEWSDLLDSYDLYNMVNFGEDSRTACDLIRFCINSGRIISVTPEPECISTDCKEDFYVESDDGTYGELCCQRNKVDLGHGLVYCNYQYILTDWEYFDRLKFKSPPKYHFTSYRAKPYYVDHTSTDKFYFPTYATPSGTSIVNNWISKSGYSLRPIESDYLFATTTDAGDFMVLAESGGSLLLSRLSDGTSVPLLLGEIEDPESITYSINEEATYLLVQHQTASDLHINTINLESLVLSHHTFATERGVSVAVDHAGDLVLASNSAVDNAGQQGYHLDDNCALAYDAMVINGVSEEDCMSKVSILAHNSAEAYNDVIALRRYEGGIHTVSLYQIDFNQAALLERFSSTNEIELKSSIHSSSIAISASYTGSLWSEAHETLFEDSESFEVFLLKDNCFSHYQSLSQGKKDIDFIWHLEDRTFLSGRSTYLPQEEYGENSITSSDLTFAYNIGAHDSLFVCPDESLDSRSLSTSKSPLVSTTFKDDSISIWPNPSSSNIYITGLNSSTPYQIYDLQGQKLLKGILSASDSSITISKLRPGMYILTLPGGERAQTFKFVKH